MKKFFYTLFITLSLFVSFDIFALTTDSRTYNNCYIDTLSSSWFGNSIYCPWYEDNGSTVVRKSNCGSQWCAESAIKLNSDSYVVFDRIYATDWNYFYISWERTTRKEFVELIWSDTKIPNGTFIFVMREALVKYYVHLICIALFCGLLYYKKQLITYWENNWLILKFKKRIGNSTITKQLIRLIQYIRGNKFLVLVILVGSYQLLWYDLIDFFWAQIFFWAFLWFFAPLCWNAPKATTISIIWFYILFNLFYVHMHVYWDGSSSKWSAWWWAMIISTICTLLTIVSLLIGYGVWKIFQFLWNKFKEDAMGIDTNSEEITLEVSDKS